MKTENTAARVAQTKNGGENAGKSGINAKSLSGSRQNGVNSRNVVGKFEANMTKKIGKIVAVYLIVTGIGFLISDEFYSNMISHKGTDPVLINLSGMVHFFIGMTILVNHFLWKNVFQTIVTLLGFMFLMKGVFLIGLPELTLQSADNPAQVPWIMYIGFILTGLIVGYMAFLRKSNNVEQ